MKKVLVAAAAAVVLSATASANQTGCGLGSMIIKSNSAVLQALAATTNGIFGNQTFGITSGTSGCSRAPLVLNEKAEQFVASNMDQLSKEAAIGHGEAIDTLAELLEVKDKAAFAVALQKNYNSIYTSKNVQMADVLNNISAI